MNATATAPSIAIIPAAQLRAALRLAVAYGHEWAGAVLNAEIPCQPFYSTEEEATAWREAYAALLANGPSLPWSPARIEAAVEAARLANPPVVSGIGCPTVHPGGVIDHETMTGRLYWQVDLDGSVMLHINRPSGWVLAAEVSPYGAISVAEAIGGRYHTRHVEALAEAINAALTGRWEPRIEEVTAAVACLYADAMLDEEGA